MKRVAILVALAVVCPVMSQESPSYQLEEHVFNSGGHPADGVVLTSASYQMTMSAIGESVVQTGLGSTSYRLDAGFASAYPPPGEVLGLEFSDKQTLTWDPEKSVGAYNLYRDLMSNLTGGGYGNCEQQDLTDETATDTDVPPDADGYFYLVTVENRLNDEGTKGTDSDGVGRPNPSPCP